MSRLAVPRMELKGCDLRDGDQTLQSVDLDVGFAVAGNSSESQKVGHPHHGVTLKKLLAPNSVRHANDRAGPSPDMLKEPRANRLVIAR
jgi:hypothetical protein